MRQVYAAYAAVNVTFVYSESVTDCQWSIWVER